MQKKAWKICVFVCVMAAFSSLLRWMQNMTIFEEDTGLASPGAFLSYAVILICAATAAALVVIVLLLRRFEAPLEYESAFRGRTVFYPVTSWLAGAIMLAGTAWLFISAGNSAYPSLMRILAILAAGCAVSVVSLHSGFKKKLSRDLKCLSALVPVLFMCFWLIVSYKEHAANPVLWQYGIEILAISSSLLGFYFLSGYGFGRPRPYITIFFCNLGAFLSIVTLPDDRMAAKQPLFFAVAGMLLFSALVLTQNLKGKDKPHK